MTLYDKRNTLSDDQAITASARSENVLYVGPGDFGGGNKMDLDVIVTEAFDNLTSLNVKLETDDDEGFGSPKALYDTGEVVLADLVIGYKFTIKAIPPGCEDYLALYYTVTGTNPTVGKIFASLTPHSQDNNPSF
jgi:hypothetical protein